MKKKPRFFPETQLAVVDHDKEPWPSCPDPLIDQMLELVFNPTGPVDFLAKCQIAAKAMGRYSGEGIKVKVGKLISRRYDRKDQWYRPCKNGALRSDRTGRYWYDFELHELFNALTGWQRKDGKEIGGKRYPPRYPKENDRRVCAYVALVLGRSPEEVYAKAEDKGWV